MMQKKFGVPVARYLYSRSLDYLKKYNPHSARVIPESSVAPIFLLHTGASLNGGGIDQIKSWLPLFERIGIEYLVVTRMMEVYEKMRCQYAHVPVSLVTNSVDADTLLQRFSSLAAFFYVSNTANNNQFLRYPEFRHIFLGHGDSDKSASVNRLFKVYDEIYVAGQAHIDRFSSADFDTSGILFKIIGRPDAVDLLRYAEEQPRAVNRIVYLPTWEGYHVDQEYSSLPIAQRVLEEANRISKLPIIAKLHPMTGSMQPQLHDIDRQLCDTLAFGEGGVHFVDRHSKLTDALAPGGIYVCDISAAVSECLAVDQPIFVYIPKNRSIRIASGKMSYADYTYVYSSTEEFANKLKQVLGGDDYLAPARKLAREYFISPQATIGKAFENELRSVAARNWQAATTASTTVESAINDWPLPGTCAACGSEALSNQTITCEVQATKGKTCKFVICDSCGFVSNPHNLHNYLESGFGPTSIPQIGTRAGDGVQPRREYRIAEMAIDILSRRSPGLSPKVLVFGPGLSRDHALIAARLPVARVAVTDMDNFQAASDFVPLDESRQKFDIVVASEVIEHFTDLEKDFTNLLSKVKDDGLVVAGTNICDGWPLHRLVYPFITGHTSYYTGRSLQAVARRFGMTVDFRVPAIAFASAGPRKRYVFFYRDPLIGECISQYFADHHLAPSE